MDSHKRVHAMRLTEANWLDSIRMRRSCGISMGAHIEDAGAGRYRVIYGFPQKGFGATEIFDSLDEALGWANHDGGGVMIGEDSDAGGAARGGASPPRPRSARGRPSRTTRPHSDHTSRRRFLGASTRDRQQAKLVTPAC
jgi:hypothetical protein